MEPLEKEEGEKKKKAADCPAIGPAWQPAQAGRRAGMPPEWAGLGAGPGRQRGRGGSRPEEHPGGPAWEPAQADGEAGGPPEGSGRETGPGRRVAGVLAEWAGLGAGPGRQ